MVWKSYITLAVFLAISASPTDAGDGAGDMKGGERLGEGFPFVTDIFSFRDSPRPQIDLCGEWEFRRDKEDKGKKLGWHEGKGASEGTVKVPGAPQAQGFGETTHFRQKNYFLDPFWLRRPFEMPAYGPNKRVWLRVGGVFPAAEIYVNGQYVGYTQSSRTQQRVEITSRVKPGERNLIAIKVCDFPELSLDGLWENGEFFKNWTGVYRPVSVEITDAVCVIDAYLQPRLASGSVHVNVDLCAGAEGPVKLLLEVLDGGKRIGQTSVELPAGETTAEADVKLGRFTAWSPAHPKLYTLRMSVVKQGEARAVDVSAIRFGMREIRADAAKLYLNGKPIYLRCYGEDQLYPETLAPPADKSWYLSRLKRARAYGMNATKSCVEILSQDYIEAADEAGIMIIQEMPFGLGPLRANRYTIDARFRDYYSRELDGLVRESRNHASVIAYSMSSELEYGNQTQESFDFFSRKLPMQTRKLAPHALVIDCTGYLNSEKTDKGMRVTDFYASIMPTWMKDVLDETPIGSDGKHPTVLHEYNWWSCYPDSESRSRYEHTQLKPYWLDTLEKTARENGQETLVPTYRRNSVWLQALCRKDGIEYARRRPNVEGFILWLLIDLGQYCEGLLDDFWNPKNVSAREFLKSSGDTVILLAEEGNRCLTAGAKARIPFVISHYGEDDLSDSILEWQAKGGMLSESGRVEIGRLGQGQLTKAGCAELDLPEAQRGYKIDVRVALKHDGRAVNTNNWSFWAFPESRSEIVRAVASGKAGAVEPAFFVRIGDGGDAAIPEGTRLTVADRVDQALADWVLQGGDCLLLSKGATIENTNQYVRGVTFHTTFRTIPWNAGPGNSGTVIAEHPALAGYPHDGMCDLQFVWMIRGVLPMEFSPLRKYGVSPVIRGIDWYMTNRNNAYLLEFRVGKGRVLTTTLGIGRECGKRIEARSLLDCLVDYVRGKQFAPSASVPEEEFLRLFGQRAE